MKLNKEERDLLYSVLTDRLDIFMEQLDPIGGSDDGEVSVTKGIAELAVEELGLGGANIWQGDPAYDTLHPKLAAFLEK